MFKQEINFTNYIINTGDIIDSRLIRGVCPRHWTRVQLTVEGIYTVTTIKSWINENLSRMYHYYTYADDVGHSLTLVIRFEDKDEALLFKLCSSNEDWNR